MFVAVETRNLQPCSASSSANYLLISDIDLFYDVIYLVVGERRGGEEPFKTIKLRQSVCDSV